MRLLYLALDCPLPANNGNRMRTWSMLRALHAEGCRITLVCQRDSGILHARAELHQACEAFWILDQRVGSLSQGHDWGRRLASLASPLPHAVRRYRSAAVRTLVRRLWASAQCEALVCDSVFGAVNVPPEAQPLILNHHNIEHRIFAAYRETETNPLKRIAAGWEGRKLYRWERAAGELAALHLVCSRVDQESLLLQQPLARVVVAPNIAPETAPTPSAEDNGAEDEGLVVFQGAMDWFPNRDAVDFFLAQIWPRVLHDQPAARLLIVGRQPPAAFLARHRRQPRVTFTGTVEDVRPYLARAAVAVVPLRIGSGTRLKILEAAAMGKAIVSTPLGAEGLALAAGSEIVLAARPEDFAQEVIGLLASPHRRRRLGEAARARVQADYSFDALRRSVRQGLQQLRSGAASHWSGAAATAWQRS
ncbi:MAG TPA: glycosyltransferase [Terriglobales bacterium]